MGFGEQRGSPAAGGFRPLGLMLRTGIYSGRLWLDGHLKIGLTPSSLCVLGVDFQVKNLLVDNKYYALQLWDTAGQER